MCLLLTPGIGAAADKMTRDRHRSQFNLHCVLAANMLMTGNLSALDPYILETWGNAEAVAVNQDKLSAPPTQLTPYVTEEHRPARRAGEDLRTSPAVVQECGGEADEQSWLFGSPFQFFMVNSVTSLCVSAPSCSGELVFGPCPTTPLACANNTLAFAQWTYDKAPLSRWRSFLPLKSPACATRTSDNTIVLETCHSPTPANQTWIYDSTHEMRTSDNMCLTAPSPSPVEKSLIVGRKVVNGWAVVFLNNDVSQQNVTCGPQCFQELGIAAGTQLNVRDLWTHQSIGTTTASIYPVLVPPAGASRFLLFSTA